MRKLELGMIVYHADVYDFREPLEVVGIRKNEVELRGDFSGGVSNTKDTSWLPIAGKVSTIYNHGKKVEYRSFAKDVLNDDNSTETEKKLAIKIKDLTTDVSLNKLF